MRISRRIRERFDHSTGGIDIAASVDVAFAANVGENSGASHASASSHHPIVQTRSRPSAGGRQRTTDPIGHPAAGSGKKETHDEQ